MANIGVTATVQSVGPTGAPDFGRSNYFVAGCSPWGIDGLPVICTSFQEYLRQFGGLNKLTTVASGTTADTYSTETTATVVQPYYAIKGYFDEKQKGSPGVLYFSRVVKSSGGATAASKTFNDTPNSNATTVTAKWKGRDGGTVQNTIINPSPRKQNLWTLQTGTVSVSGTAVTGVGTTFVTGSTWNGYGIRIGDNYYTISSVGSTTALTLTASGTTVSGASFYVGAPTTTAYVKWYHPKSNITEEWDFSNATDCASISKKSQLCTIALPAGGSLPTASATSKLNSGSAATADAYDATDADLVGTTSSAGVKTGLQVFNDLKLGTGFIAIPGKYSSTVRSGLLTHAASYYRHALIGSGSGLTLSTVTGDLGATSSQRASYWYPQIYVSDLSSETGGQILVDPVGHIAGLAARMDRDYGGPHKSPAGLQHPLTSALDVERQSNYAELIDDSGSNTLGDFFINTIRVKGNPQAVVSWGLRTLAADGRYRQIPVSRVVDDVLLTGSLICEQYVMEPIDPFGRLFAKVKGDMDAYLSGLYRAGALFGSAPGKELKSDNAWFVICDRSNNPDVEIGAGKLHVDVYIVPTPNAEQILLNIFATAPGFVGRAT